MGSRDVIRASPGSMDGMASPTLHEQQGRPDAAPDRAGVARRRAEPREHRADLRRSLGPRGLARRPWDPASGVDGQFDILVEGDRIARVAPRGKAGSKADVVDGEDGNDYIKGGSGDDIIIGGNDNDRIKGLGGENKREFDNFNMRVISISENALKNVGKGKGVRFIAPDTAVSPASPKTGASPARRSA